MRGKSYQSYQKRNVCLFRGDCRDILKKFPDSYFDAIITDPLYGLQFDSYDNSNNVFFELEDEFFRVLKKGGWFIFWWTIKKVPDISKLKRFIYKWMLIAEFRTSCAKSVVGDRTYIPIFVFCKGDGRINMRLCDSLPARELPQIEGVKIKQGDFKPTYAQALLIQMFAGKEGKVLDPFAGFGSLLLASLLTGVGNVVGIEKDPLRFQVAKLLLEEEGIPYSIPEIMEAIEQEVESENKEKRKNKTVRITNLIRERKTRNGYLFL